jgi:hypothetical protein
VHGKPAVIEIAVTASGKGLPLIGVKISLVGYFMKLQKNPLS